MLSKTAEILFGVTLVGGHIAVPALAVYLSIYYSNPAFYGLLLFMFLLAAIDAIVVAGDRQ